MHLCQNVLDLTRTNLNGVWSGADECSAPGKHAGLDEQHSGKTIRPCIVHCTMFQGCTMYICTFVVCKMFYLNFCLILILPSVFFYLEYRPHRIQNRIFQVFFPYSSQLLVFYYLIPMSSLEIVQRIYH